MADAGPDDWVVPSAAAASSSSAPAASAAPARQTIDAGPDDWVTPAAVNATPPSVAADVAKAVPSGLASGVAALAGTPRAIHDLAQAGADWFTGQTVGRVANYLKTGSATADSASDVGSARDALPSVVKGQAPSAADVQGGIEQVTGPLYQAQTLPGQFAQKTAEFLPSTLIGPGGLAAKGVMAAGSAAGDMGAGAVTQGTYLEPYARAAGALAGGVGSALTIHGAQAIAPALSDSAARSKAASMFLEGAEDPATLRATVAADTGTGEIVPGSKPTSFQRYGDVGLGDIERAVNTRNPQAFVSNDYGTGTQQQNAAQVAAMRGVQTGGDAMSVPDLFLSQKRGLEDFHDFMSAQAARDAEGQADALGGTGTATQTGQAIKGALDPQVATARQGITNSIDAIGGTQSPADYGAAIKSDLDPLYRTAQTDAASQAAALGGTDRVDTYGAGLRGFAQTAADASAEQHGRLFDAVPSDMTVPLGPVQQFGANLYKGMGPAMLKTVTPAERDIADVLGQYGPQVSFGEARNLDTLITSSMRAERKANGVSPSYARMVQLKGAWEDAIHNALGVQSQADDAAVATGTLDPSQTTSARLQAATGNGGAPGAPAVAFTPAGRKIGTDYGVADLSDLTTSHAADGTPNPAFPAELQPRDRTRAASQAQVAEISSNLQPERLGFSTSTTDGAPIVGPDGVVESGNGRVAALGRAYAANGPQAAAYRDFLTGQGYDLSGIDRPVLVRQRTTDLSPADRVAFTQESNAPTVAAMSAPERAAADAGRMSDDLLAGYQGGDINSAANRPFVRSFVGSVPAAGERGAMAAADGTLSMEGGQRIRNALLHAGYGDSRLVSSMAETGDPDIAAFGRSLQDNAGSMAQLRRRIDAGDVHPDADLSGYALEAAGVVQRARSIGQPIRAVVDQADAFNPISDEAHTLLRAGYGDDLSGRFSRSRMNAILRDAIGEAQQQTVGTRLFGDNLSAQEILDGARTRYGSRQATGTAGPIADGAGDLGAGNRQAGNAGRESSAGSIGPGSRSEGQGSRVLPDTTPAGPPITQDAIDKLRDAKDAFIQHVATYRKGPVGAMLKSDATSGSYRMADSAVPASVFPSGPKGYQAVQAYKRAVGDQTEAAGLLHNYAAATLRKVALNDDGTLNPAGYARWRNQYGEAFRALPESVQARFNSAGRAAEALNRFGRFSPETAASLVPDQFFRSGVGGADGVAHLQSLVGADRANAVLGDYAASSLRRAASRPDGTIDPSRYTTWRRNFGEALRALPDDVQARFDTAAHAADALKRFGAYTPDMAPPAVPEMFLAPGKAGAEGVDHLRSLMGDQQADAILSDHAAALLKAKAERPDGTIDPRGLAQFMKSYGPAMERFPQLAERFGSAAKATQTIADVAAGRAKALKDFQATAAGKFMGLTDPTEVRDAVGRMIERNDVSGLGRLMDQVKGDPAAVEGVKRAAADHVLSRSLSYGQEAGASGVKQVNKATFQNLVGENRAALSRVFSQDQMNTLDALSADMMRQKRSVEALKMKGSPNTTADAIRAMKFEPKGHGGSLLREVAEAAIGGEELGGAHGAEIGAGIAVANKVRTALRDAGMRRTYDVIERAVIDPEFFRTLLMDAPKTAGTGSHVTLANRLGRYSMYRGLQAETAAQDQRRAG